MGWTFIVRKVDGVLSYEDLGGYETRNPSTFWCIKNADAVYNWPDFNDLVIQTTDYEHNSNDYTYSKQHSYNRLVPDFNFHGWPQVGINDYEEFVKDIDTAGNVSYEVNKVGWIGNINTKEVRAKLFNFGKENKATCEIIDCGNWSNNPDSIKLNSNKYISTPDLVKRYSILLDIEGNGYSGRLKHLLWSHRPVLFVDRPHVEYFYKYLYEWEHYIPVKRDLSDLKEKIQWCLENPDKTSAIAERAYKFSQKHLTREACYKEWDKIIKKHISNK